MEESILSDVNSYSGGSEVGLADVYSRSETLVGEDVLSIELDNLHNPGILYTSVDIADVSPRDMSMSENPYYEGIEPLPENSANNAPGGRYLESSDQLNQLHQSNDSLSETSSTDHNSDESSWNERFQRIYNTENSLEKYLALGKLVKDFVDTAQTYGKVIISESALPVSEKTIKPKLDIGIAGGDKYICAGILFKYATDKELNGGFWMYGGDHRKDEFALKSANHELKGIISYLNAGVKELCLPLMAVIDYAGIRLVAVALLPINETTLRYGSNNAGRTIHNSDKKLNMHIERVAKKLNIKGHPVGLTKKVLFGPGDLEGHLGTDDRYYVLDFARLYPPEPPSKRNLHQRATWFNLLRPELVASNSVPLSPDAYSCFESESTRTVSKKEIVHATVRLYKVIIPKFAKDFDDAQSLANGSTDHNQLIESLHRAGINIRHLGFVLLKTTTQVARSIILTEMVARVIKNEIKNAFREQSMLFSSRDKIQQIILDEMNAITETNSLNYVTFWTNRVHALLQNKFQYNYAEDPLNSEVEIESLVDKRVLIDKLEMMIGFKLTHAAKQSFLESGTAVFREVDIKSIEPRVKHLNIVDYAEGAVYMYLAKSCGERETSRWKQYLQNAIKSFASALSAAPFDGSSCYKLARCLHKITELELDNGPFESLVKQASEKYAQSILFGYSPEKVLERRGQLLLMAAGRTNEEKYYQLAGESYQQAFRYPSCMHIIKELFERANEEQGEKLLNTLKLSLYCPVLQYQFAHELTRIDVSKVAAFSQAELILLFSGLNKVKELLVSTLNINDEFIEFAANKWPGLEKLDISGILNITDRGLAAVSKCTDLKYLNLDRMGMISNEGLIKLSKACSKIEELSICQCSQITEACLIQVTDNLPHLQHFHCIMFHELQPKLFTSEGLIQLVRPGTKTLRVSVHRLTNDSAAQLIQKINQTGAKIENIAFYRESDMIADRDADTRGELISEEGFIPLFNVLPHLKSIEISNLNISDDALRFMLAHCTNLEKIVLASLICSDLSSEWLDAITPNNSKLQHLELRSTANETSRVPLIKQLATSCPRLATLKTESFYLPDELIAMSNCFPYLQTLDVSFNRYLNIDDVVIRLCCESWRNLKKIRLEACDKVFGFVDSLLHLSKNTPKLQSLSLRILDEINPMALADFFYQPKPKITKLDLYKSAPVNDEAMAKILPLVPNLTHLNLSYTRVTNKTVNLLAQHVPKLRKLYMDGVAGLTDSAFIDVAKKLKHLRVISVGEQMSLNGGCVAYFAYYCDNLQRVAMRVSEDLYVDPSVLTSHLTCTIIWRAKVMFLFCKKIQGPMRLEMLKKSAEILNRVLCTMPEYLNDYKAFWLANAQKMDSDALHQYIYMLDYCPQIINLLQSYWQYYPNDELFTSSSLKLTRNYLVSKTTLIKVLSALTQPISLHMANCMWFTPGEVVEVLSSFQFKSLHLYNDTWQLFHQSIAKLSTLSQSSLVSLEVSNHYDLQALDVAKFTNLTNLDASFSTRDSIWGAGELTAILASCKGLKRIDFSGRHQASASVLTDSDAESLTFEKFRAGVAVSLADAARLLKNSPSLLDLRIRIGADGGLDRVIIGNLVSLELFETHLTNDILTSLTTCQHLKEFSAVYCTFGADSHDAFRSFFSSLVFTKLVMVPKNKRELNQHVFESIAQQSQLQHFEIAFHPCPRWQTWITLIEKNVSLKKFIIRDGSVMVHFALQKIIPLLPPLETFTGISLDDNLLAILAQNSQKTLKVLNLSASSDLTECKALGLCRKMEVLDLSYCNIKDEDLMHVTTCLSGQLQEVYLRQCKNISSATIIALLQHCPRLRRMNVSECVQLTDSVLPALQEYGNCLEEVDLTQCPLLTVDKIDQLKLFSVVQLRASRNIFGYMISEEVKQIHVSYDNLFKALARKVCTRSLLKNYSVRQEATYCTTCQAVVCKSCLIKCHKGHEVNDENYFSVTCQCSVNCKCQK